MRIVFVIVFALWLVAGAATLAVYRGYRRGERSRTDLSGVVAGLAACSGGLVAIAAFATSTA